MLGFETLRTPLTNRTFLRYPFGFRAARTILDS
jgi:hypothetical protein